MLRIYTDIDSLGNEWTKIFGDHNINNIYMTVAWYKAQFSSTAEEGSRANLIVFINSNNNARFIFPSRYGKKTLGRLSLPRVLGGYTNDYTGEFVPIRNPQQSLTETEAQQFVSEVADHFPFDAFVMDKTDLGDPTVSSLEKAFRASHFYIEHFFNFRNRYEPVRGGNFAAYLSARPTKFRNDLRRRMRRFKEQFPKARFIILSEPEGLKDSIAAFKQVYARSWKGAERYPNFIEKLCWEAMRSGSLRLSVLYDGSQPIAAKICFVVNGCLSMFKTAYDPNYAEYAPGTIINYLTIEHILEREKIELIEFGIGNEKYKEKWASKVRFRNGFIAYNLLRPRGVIAATISCASTCSRPARQLLKKLAGR